MTEISQQQKEKKSTSKREKRELYQDAQKRLVASLLFDSSLTDRVLELINEEDIEEPRFAIIFEIIADLSRRNEKISYLTVAKELQDRGELAKSGGTSELFALTVAGEKYLLDANAVKYAELIKEASIKSKVSSTLNESLDNFTDDSGVQAADAVSSLQSYLNDQLLKLSDSSTISRFNEEFDDYLELLKEREKVSKENEGNAEGLQGIPSLLPTLNKYTTGWLPGQLITVGAGTGMGKALSISTPILTSTGWVLMRDLKVGCKVFGPDGKLTSITNITDIMRDRKCYEITFNNGEKITADAEHQWMVNTNDKGNHIVTTQNMVDSPDTTFYIKNNKPLNYEEQRQPIDPFLLGAYYTDDRLRLEKYNLMSISQLGIVGNPHIPRNYLTTSLENRISLYNGLVNSAMMSRKKYFIVENKNLAEDIVELLGSIGKDFTSNFTIRNGSINEKLSGYSFHFDSIIYNYSGTTAALKIVGIKEVDSVPVRCIEVDNKDHMYLAGKSLVPTHNSIFSVNCAIAAAMANKSVMFFSLEMEKNEIEDRILSATTGIPQGKLKNGLLDADDMKFVKAQMKKMENMKLVIDVEPNQTVDTIRARSLRQAQTPDGLDFIIVDYLQLITPTGRFNSRQEAVAEISRNMKLLAKQLGVPIMVLVQMRRKDKNDEDGANNIPKIEEIRESGAIAQDSDIIILLHRDTEIKDHTPHTLVILAKQRGGVANKIITCHSNLECSMFREITRVKDTAELMDDDMSDLGDEDIDLSNSEDYSMGDEYDFINDMDDIDDIDLDLGD